MLKGAPPVVVFCTGRGPGPLQRVYCAGRQRMIIRWRHVGQTICVPDVLGACWVMPVSTVGAFSVVAGASAAGCSVVAGA